MVVSRLMLLVVVCLMTLSCAAVSGCDEKEDDSKTADVKLDGKTFTLELALDDEHRFKGLSGRTEIPENGGMLFVFTDRMTRQHSFVMRDCPVDIDIIYLDPAGHIVATYEMKAEEPRGEGETELTGDAGYPDWAKTNQKYEDRLKKYPSRHAAQFVIELKGGTIKNLKLKNGLKIDLDLKGLKKRAK